MIGLEDAIIALNEAYVRENNLYYSSRIGDVLDFVENQADTIQSLKCCSNCKHSRSMMGDCDLPKELDSECCNSNPLDWEYRELLNT